MADLPDLSRCRPISVTSSSSSKPAPFATGGHHCDRSMELATGALPSVLAKLSDLLVGEYKLPKGLMGKEEITFLQAELENMHGTLEEFAARPAHRVEEVQRFWAWRVKDLSYDIEDIIDTFMVGGKGGKLAKPHVFKKFIERSHYNRNRYHSKISIKNDVIKSAKIDPGKFHRPMDVTEPVGIEKARDEAWSPNLA
ncbi:hypothetical protein QOZ80_9BG0714700 [Eleusine coracana subsp. coracana]|nr:hypothetical protein QOZ80_9BG0714700 [Eleusine coracana subsp. coracana]